MTTELTAVLGIAVSSIAFPIEAAFSNGSAAVRLATICKSRVLLPVEAAIEAAIETAIVAAIEAAVIARTFTPAEASCLGGTLSTHAIEVVTLSRVAPCLAIHEAVALPFCHRWRCRWPAFPDTILACLTTPSRGIETFSTFPEALAMSFPRLFLLVRGII